MVLGVSLSAKYNMWLEVQSLVSTSNQSIVVDHRHRQLLNSIDEEEESRADSQLAYEEDVAGLVLTLQRGSILTGQLIQERNHPLYTKETERHLIYRILGTDFIQDPLHDISQVVRLNWFIPEQSSWFLHNPRWNCTTWRESKGSLTPPPHTISGLIPWTSRVFPVRFACLLYRVSRLRRVSR